MNIVSNVPLDPFLNRNIASLTPKLSVLNNIFYFNNFMEFLKVEEFFIKVLNSYPRNMKNVSHIYS